jgi:transmembrane sensor
MNREEFIRLSEKYLSGKATSEEQEMLQSFKDKIKLEDDTWDDSMGDQEQIYQEILGSISYRVAAINRRRKIFSYSWRIAASIAIILSVGFFWKTGVFNRKEVASLIKKPVIPATDHAYLTLSDGTKILLDTGKNSLTTEFGIELHKDKDGLLVYNLSGADNSIPLTESLYHEISTPKGGRYSIVLADSSRVWLNAGSSIRFPLTFTGKQRIVEISGEAYFEVAKNKAKPFIVRANQAEVEVLGTHFNVSAYAEDKFVKTTLLEGSVRFQHKNNSTILTPGHMASAAIDEKSIQTKKADLEEAVSWKNGLFIFRDENITEVMKKFSRWYDVDVDFEGNVRDKEFGGSISRFKDITEILEMMKLAGGINYKIDGRRVTIMN